METCVHGDAWFVVKILEEAREQQCCFDCATEEIQELPLGWHLDITRVGE